MTKRRSKRKPSSRQTAVDVVDPFRHLGRQLAGVIFGCSNDTHRECVDEGVFGLPLTHFSYVKSIRVGFPVFLFNYTTRELHGVFAAASAGQLNIHPHGWTGNNNERTQYPAQIKVKVHKAATPLKEHQFKPAIRGNYNNEGPLFQFELDIAQVKHLCRLYKSTVPQAMDGTRLGLLGPPRIEQQQPIRNGRLRERTSQRERHQQRDAYSREASNRRQLNRNRDRESSDESIDAAGLGHRASGGCVVSAEVIYSISAANINRSSGTSTRTESVASRSERMTARIPGHPSSKSVTSGPKRRTLGEANGLFKPEETIKKPCEADLVVKTELKVPKDDLLTQFLQSKEPGWQFSPHSGQDTLLLFGGVNEGNYFTKMEMLQSDGAAWNEICLIPGLEGCHLSALNVQDGFFLLGNGFHRNPPFNAVESLRPGWKRWHSMAPWNTPRPHAAAVSLASTIYTVGGGNPFEESSGCDCFDCPTNTWSRAAPLQQPRTGSAACVHGSAIYVTGGGLGSSVLQTTERSDHRCHSWQILSSAPVGRKHHACIAFEHQLWVLGGMNAQGQYLSSVEVMDLRNQRWMSQPDLNQPRAFFTVEVFQKALHVLGGSVSPAEYRFLKGERFDPLLNAWVEGLSVGTGHKRGYHTSCVIPAL